jgi:hypothetical protein
MTIVVILSLLLFVLVTMVCWRIGLFDSASQFQDLAYTFIAAIFGILWAFPTLLMIVIWHLLNWS